MIDGIRRRLGKPVGKDSWSSDQELRPETGLVTELSSDASVLVASTEGVGHYAPADANTPDYYKSLVQTAIENGGRYGGHHISIPWLRMTLAGLEFKRVEPEMMWDGFEPGAVADEHPSRFPSYDAVFPSEGPF